MANIELEDTYGSISCTVFPKHLLQYASILSEGTVLEVTARVSFYEGRDTELLMEQARVITAEDTKKTIKKRPHHTMQSFSLTLHTVLKIWQGCRMVYGGFRYEW